MEFKQMWKWLSDWLSQLGFISCEVPSDDCSSNDEILTSDDELNNECVGNPVENVGILCYGVIFSGITYDYVECYENQGGYDDGDESLEKNVIIKKFENLTRFSPKS